MTQFSDIGAAAVEAVKDKDFAKDLSRAIDRPHLIGRDHKGNEIDLGTVKPDSITINGRPASIDDFVAALKSIRWDVPHECKECGK